MLRYNIEVKKKTKLSLRRTRFICISINLYKKILYSFSNHHAENMASCELTVQYILLHKLNVYNINMECYFEICLKLNFSQASLITFF